MLRFVAVHAIVGGVSSGGIVAAVGVGATPDHQLLLGMLTTIGVLGGATITGYFAYLAARMRSDLADRAEPKVASPMDSDDVNELRHTLHELTELLRIQIRENTHKEALIERQALQLSELQQRRRR